MAAERPADAEDPVEYFLQDMTYHGKTDRTRDTYERAFRVLESFLGDPSRNPAGTARSVDDATHRDYMTQIHTLRNRDVAPSTVATYAPYLRRFYAYMAQVGAFDSDPIGLAMEEMGERIDTSPARRELSVPQMRGLVRDIAHPLDHTLAVTLLKTGTRVGELCNPDLRDVSLSAETPLDDVSTHAALDGHGSSVYVAADPSVGSVTNGEERTVPNKRKWSAVVPVGDELEAVLLRWLVIRPNSPSPAEPLFVGTAPGWGRRLEPDVVHHVVTAHATDAGWYRTGGDREENVTPHYFRHFFTTHLRDRIGDHDIIKYLRGDVAGDIIDTYTYNWGDGVHETYESNIYSLR